MKYIFNSKKALLILLFLFLSTGSIHAQTVKAEKAPGFNAMFRRTTGWTGADGAYSLKLSENKVLWLYGDTWVGDIKDGKRCNAELVNNSLAIQEGFDPKTAKVKFYTGKKVKGKPAAFITPYDNKGWYWFYDGIRTKKGLYMFLMHIDRTSENDVFGFKQLGSAIAWVKNPDDDPEKWIMEQKKIPFTYSNKSGDINFGCALFNDGKHTYIYGFREKMKGKEKIKYMVAARTGSDDILDFGKWEFYSKGKWVPNVDGADDIVENIANEYSVSYLPSFKKYVLVYSQGGFSPNILVQLSSAPYGPWEKPICVYKCPEFDKKRGVFCYAAKAHPELAKEPGELIITYADNTFEFKLLTEDASLYWPIFIRVKLTDNKPQANTN